MAEWLSRQQTSLLREGHGTVQWPSRRTACTRWYSGQHPVSSFCSVFPVRRRASLPWREGLAPPGSARLLHVCPYPGREALLHRVWTVDCTLLGWGGSRPSFGFPGCHGTVQCGFRGGGKFSGNIKQYFTHRCRTKEKLKLRTSSRSTTI